MTTSHSDTFYTSRLSDTRNTARTVCLTLSFDYREWSHPIFVEAVGCLSLERGKEKDLIEEIEEELTDQLLDLFGVQVLGLLSDEGVWYDGEPGFIISWYHRDPKQKKVYRW